MVHPFLPYDLPGIFEFATETTVEASLTVACQEPVTGS